MKDADVQRPDGKFYSLSEDLVYRINNITLGDIDGWIDVCEDLSNHFSLIPIYRLNKDRDRCKAPINPEWADCCYERSIFDKSDFVANNSGIACGPASSLIVLNIYDSLLFQDFLAEKGYELRDDTFIVEAGDGTRQYYYQYPNDGCKYSTRPAKKTITDEFGVEKGVTVFEIIGCDGYTLAPGSIDPFTFKHSKVVSNQRIAEAPAWLLDICRYETIRLAVQQDIELIQPEGVEEVENSSGFNEINNLCADELSNSYLNASPQERFKKHFDNLVGWGIDKNIAFWTNPTEAFSCSNYLAFPKSKRQYLCLDIDWEGSATVWMDEGLPEPTITFVNPENGHSTLVYELELPVYWPCEQNHFRANHRPVKYFKAVQKGFTAFVRGDSGYTNSTIKNPFSKKWRVTWHNKQYTLAYLAEFVQLVNACHENNKFRTKNYAGRNEELFYTLSIWSYRNVKKYKNNDLFYDDLMNVASSINSETIPLHWPQKGPLALSEVCGIVRGVCRYACLHRHDPNLKHLFKNYGILGFTQIPDDVLGLKREQITRSRQSQGAHYTHDVVKNNTKKKIHDAIERMRTKNQKINCLSISNESRIGYNNVRNHKEYIREILSK